MPYHALQQGSRRVENLTRLRVDVHLGILATQVIAPTGTSMELQLPFGALATRDITASRNDFGLGDLELRLRQSLGHFSPRTRTVAFGVTIGATAPTGPYVPRSGAANLAPEASFLTLGRGAPFWIVEADASGSPHRRVTLFTQLAGRGPMTRTRDDFAWSNEVRAIAGIDVVALRNELSFAATFEALYRGKSTEPDPFSNTRLEAASAGGIFTTVSLSARVQLPQRLAMLVGARIPLFNDVVGNQLVPGVGAFLSLSYRRAIEPRRQRPMRYVPRPGRVTVVDYWASWCTPCKEVSARLDRLTRARPSLRVVKIDATAWTSEEMQAAIGTTGLPLVETFDRDGRMTHRLTGSDAQRVETILMDLAY